MRKQSRRFAVRMNAVFLRVSQITCLGGDPLSIGRNPLAVLVRCRSVRETGLIRSGMRIVRTGRRLSECGAACGAICGDADEGGDHQDLLHNGFLKVGWR